MPSQVIEASAHSAAPRDVVWRVIADARRWSEWGPWDRAEIERPGEGEDHGLGAIKVLIRRPVRTRELITAFEPPERFGYRVLSGLPVRDYNATVTLTEGDADGTEIRWRSEFDPKLPGTGALLRRWLQGVITQVAERAASEAERQAAASAA